MPEPMVPPAVGQVWKDNDKRVPYRHLLVTAVDATHVTAVEVTYNAKQGRVLGLSGRTTRLRINRLRPTSTGYVYVTTISAEQADALLA